MPGTEFKNQVDNLMNILFGAGVASHATIIEQINYLVFLRSLSKKDDSAMILDSSAEKIFSGELAKYHWDNLLVINAEVLFTTLEEIFRKLPELATDQTIRLLFRDAHVKIFDKPTLRRLVHEIEKMMSELEKEASSGHTDIFGDMYEYLLSKQAQAGTLGQFRTPRHIIKFIIDIVDPNKGETILDPACGTAGFLVSALEHLKEKYTSDELKKEGRLVMDKLSKGERDFVYQHTFTGFDSDFDMFKFGLMNLYLHKLEHPNIKRQNTLVDTAGDRTKWDIILANPPFAGALDHGSVSEDLMMGTGATELLFVRYIIDHLSHNGRAGVIVPDGVLFGNTKSHLRVRKMLVEDCSLEAVISLPVGVFLPYADASTAILIFRKGNKDKKVVFYDINADGYSLDDRRSPVKENDLPAFLDKWKSDSFSEHECVKTSTIENTGYSLFSGDYKNYDNETHNLPAGWKKIPLGELIEEVSKKAGLNTDHKVLSITKSDGFVESSQFFKKTVHSKNLSGYKLINKGQFAYSPIHIDEGSIAYLKDFDTGLISPMYKVFQIKNKYSEILNPIFLINALKSDKYLDIYKDSGKGSVKRRKAVSFEKLSSIFLIIPPTILQEQIKTVSNEIDRYLFKVKVEKIKLRGLLNNLFK